MFCWLLNKIWRLFLVWLGPGGKKEMIPRQNNKHIKVFVQMAALFHWSGDKEDCNNSIIKTSTRNYNVPQDGRQTHVIRQRERKKKKSRKRSSPLHAIATPPFKILKKCRSQHQDTCPLEKRGGASEGGWKWSGDWKDSRGRKPGAKGKKSR